MRSLVVFLGSLTVAVVAQTSLPGSNVNVHSFDSVDTDTDGAISWTEFNHWATKKLHLKDEQKKQLFLSHDRDGDGELIISEFVPLAYDISTKPVISNSDVFERLDTNHDGFIDASERSFSGVDAIVINGMVLVGDINGDGLLSREEFDRATDTGRAKTQEEKNRELAVQLVSDMDTDKDQKLTLAEIGKFAAKFGKVSSAELSTAFSSLDSNKDGLVDINELSRVPSKIGKFMSFEAPPPVRSDIARMKPVRL